MITKNKLVILSVAILLIKYSSQGDDQARPALETTVVEQDVIFVLEPFILSELSTDKITSRFYFIDTSKLTNGSPAAAALLGDYYGLIELSGNNSYNLLGGKLPKSTFFNDSDEALDTAGINAKLLKYNFEFSKVENAYGYICTFIVSPSGAVTTTSINSKQTIKFGKPGKINCSKVDFNVGGKIRIKPRGFEFYSSLVFSVTIFETGKTEKAIAEAYVTYNTNLDDSKIDSDGFGPEVAVKFNNSVQFGKDITIKAVCDTTDYYACTVDNAIGTLNEDLTFQIKCSPRSKKYDKLYTTAWILAIILLLVLGGSVGYHYYKNSRNGI